MQARHSQTTFEGQTLPGLTPVSSCKLPNDGKNWIAFLRWKNEAQNGGRKKTKSGEKARNEKREEREGKVGNGGGRG